MSLTQFIKKETTSIGLQPIQRKPASFTEVLSKSFRSTRDNFITTSRNRLIEEQRNKRAKLFEKITGEKLDPTKATNYQPFKEPQQSLQLGLDPQNIDILRQKHNDKFVEEYIKELKLKEPEKYKKILTENELIEQAGKQANLSRQELEKAATRSNTLPRITASLLGGLGATATDPVNIAFLPFGVSRGAGILKTVLTEAGINAGAELATQPFIAKWQKEIGQEYGFKDVVQNVGFAAMFGGGFAGVVKGAKPTAMLVYNKMSKLKNLKPSERAAALYMEKAAHLKESLPFVKKKSAADAKKHYESIEETLKAFQEGKTVTAENLKITNTEFLEIDTAISKNDTITKQVQAQEIKRFQEKSILNKQDIEEPQYTIENLPQQILNKVETKINQKKKVKETDFKPEEIEILKLAGYKSNKNKVYDSKPFEKEIKARKETGTNIDIKGKENQHIEDFKQQKNIKSLKNQNINQEVKNVKDSLSQENLLDDNIEPSFMDKILEENNNPDFLKSQELDFRTLTEENPDLLISTDRGEFTLRQLLDEFEADDKYISEITTCAIGK